MKVSEISIKCGVSEQSIRAYFQREKVTKIGGRWQPTDQELETLFNYYNVRQIAQDNAGECNETQENTSLLSVLEAQLQTLQEQLKVKDDQIGELQELIGKQQETIAGLIETNKALAATNAVQVAADKKPVLLDAVETSNDDQDQEIIQDHKEDREKKGFWARLFGR